MAKRPDLDALTVPKDDVAAPIVQEAGAKAYAHTLSFRQTAEGYRRLRRFVADMEDRTGQRVTHQAVIEAALEAHLSKLGG